MHSAWVVGIAAAFLAWLLTGLVRRHALRAGILDVPNERSSHRVPTPRGGGLAIFVTVSLGAVALWLGSLIEDEVAWAMLLGGSLVAAVGYIDDRAGLSARVRLSVHAIAALVVFVALGPSTLAAAMLPGWPLPAALALLLVAFCWWINLFNFMDGIDGIAASEAVFIASAGALLTLYGGGPSGQVGLAVLVAAASAGFLFWNWPPARIFMGDVGSGFLGFVLGLLAWYSVVATGAVSVWSWLILGSLFVADATATLIRRALRREPWYRAHRSHAYQQLSRRWNSHRRTTVAYAALNALVVLPLAILSVLWPDWASAIAIVWLAAAASMAVACGAGRAEDRQ